jgi:hypothetical protein
MTTLLWYGKYAMCVYCIGVCMCVRVCAYYCCHCHLTASVYFHGYSKVPWSQKRLWWCIVAQLVACGESVGYSTPTSLGSRDKAPQHSATWAVPVRLEAICRVSHISWENNEVSGKGKSVQLVIWHDEKKAVHCLVTFFTFQLVTVTLSEAGLACF